MKIVCYVLFAFMCSVMLVGCVSGPRRVGPEWDQFVENSKVVNQAKRSYRLGHNAAYGSTVTWTDLAQCLPAGWKPVCMKGGKIEPGILGREMKCSVHGQLINSSDRKRRLRQAAP